MIALPGQWMALNTRAKLTEAAARHLARSYQRAKPSRLVETATGRFSACPYRYEDTWLVGVVYELAEPASGK